jgi:hypothetical protein
MVEIIIIPLADDGTSRKLYGQISKSAQTSLLRRRMPADVFSIQALQMSFRAFSIRLRDEVRNDDELFMGIGLRAKHRDTSFKK